MLRQLVRPAGLPDLWLGGPATLGFILLYILGEAISTTQGQIPDWAPSQMHEAPEASEGGHQWYVCRCSPILALNVDLPLPGGILQSPQRLPSPDPREEWCVPVLSGRRVSQRASPDVKVGRPTVCGGHRARLWEVEFNTMQRPTLPSGLCLSPYHLTG